MFQIKEKNLGRYNIPMIIVWFLLTGSMSSSTQRKRPAASHHHSRIDLTNPEQIKGFHMMNIRHVIRTRADPNQKHCYKI